MIPLLLLALIRLPFHTQLTPDPFAPLTVYNGTWTVNAEHPFSSPPASVSAMRPRVLVASSLSFCLLVLTSCSSKPSTATATANLDIWVVAWGASPENATQTTADPGGAEQTFRSFFYPTVSGTMERVRFSNYFGTAPVTIGAARLAIATTPPAVDPANDVPLSFGGAASVTIAPGTEVMSDPVSLTYAFGKKMAVTAYVQGTFAGIINTSPIR